MQLGSAQYAKVAERIKEFRSDNPRALIETTPTITDAHIIFKARIVKDKADPASAEASGHSMGIVKGDKEKLFEKQETIAVGRALALMGYLASGEIASSEEMEAFEAEQQEKLADAIFEITESIGNCATQDELKKYWSSLSGEMKLHVEEAKDRKKKELSEVKDVQVEEPKPDGETIVDASSHGRLNGVPEEPKPVTRKKKENGS